MSTQNEFKKHYKRYIKSGGAGPLMKVEDVDEENMSIIAGEIFRLSKLVEDPYDAYVQIISKYGIICPHPQRKRLYDGCFRSDTPIARYRWYNCEMCQCSVFNEHWMWRVREEEKKAHG